MHRLAQVVARGRQEAGLGAVGGGGPVALQFQVRISARFSKRNATVVLRLR